MPLPSILDNGPRSPGTEHGMHAKRALDIWLMLITTDTLSSKPAQSLEGKFH